MCLSNSYLIYDPGKQYIDMIHNNITHIPSLVTHFRTVGRLKLYPWSLHTLFGRYENYEESIKYYMFQKHD